MPNFFKKLKKEVVEAEEKILHKKPWYKKIHWWLIIVFLLVIIIIAYAYLAYIKPLTNSVMLARQTQQKFLQVEKSLTDADFVQARKDIDAARTSLNQLKLNFSQLDTPLLFGSLKNNYQAVESMILAINEFSKGLYLLTEISEDILNKVTRTSDGNLNISPAKRQQILENFVKKSPELNGAKSQINLALIELQQIDTDQLNDQLKKYYLELKTKLILLSHFLEKSSSLSSSMPYLMGLEEERTYLFLLQNYHELRPTGGFIGTLGIVKVKDGEIISFETNNVYDYDKYAHNNLKVSPPEPIKKYLGVDGWYLRDSNWNPNFIESAKTIEWFFHQEVGLSNGNLKDHSIDGIIAITPKIIEDFLSITGAIEIDSIVFNSENFVDRLQYLVEVGYQEQGVEYFQRKNIIGKLSKRLIERTQNINLEGWINLLKSFFENLNQKHILVYVKNPDIQQIIADEDWSGRIKQTNSDYLMVVDANLAALKSNQCVTRSLNYSLFPMTTEGKKKMKATLVINYQNNCDFTWKSTRYRTYTRVYAPKGSEWIRTLGSMDNDRSAKPGVTDISTKDNKTIFGTFIAIEPQQSGDLIFEYFLPDEITRDIYNGENYSLYLQKQPGTLADTQIINLNFPNSIQTVLPSTEQNKQLQNNRLQKSTNLQTDLEYTISFK